MWPAVQVQRRERASHRAVLCAAAGRQDAPSTLQQLAGVALGAAAAVSLAFAPLPAHAVSGGGGESRAAGAAMHCTRALPPALPAPPPPGR